MKIHKGVVTNYNITARTGLMRIEGEMGKVGFSLNRQRPFKAGIHEPVFGGSDTMIPSVGTQVIATLAVSYIREVTLLRRTLRRHAEVLKWGFQSSYDEAAREITDRPRYEVVEFTLYNDNPTSAENQRQVIAVGTAEEIQARFPRGTHNDPLAAEKTFLGFTYRRRFYPIKKDGEKFQCADPRPVPAGSTAEKFRPTNERGELLATAQDLVIGLVIPDLPKKQVRLQSWVTAS